MAWWQAAVLALFCYLGALTTPWALGTSGGWYVITRPLVASRVLQQFRDLWHVGRTA